MKMGFAWSLALASLVAILPTDTYADDDTTAPATRISLMGCVQRETDYRRENDAGRGGFLGFGGGLGDEYVLVNASPTADGAFGDCSRAAGGEAYELTGSAEEDLEAFVGQRIALTGIRKEAEIDTATGRPTGGRQAGDDLKLFEVEVDSFRPLAAPVQTGTIARNQQEPAPRQLGQQPRDDVGAATSGVEREQDEEQLPRTASPLALAGLISVLSLGGAFAARALRRRQASMF
jgi:hypothetical protein